MSPDQLATELAQWNELYARASSFVYTYVDRTVQMLDVIGEPAVVARAAQLGMNNTNWSRDHVIAFTSILVTELALRIRAARDE